MLPKAASSASCCQEKHHFLVHIDMLCRFPFFNAICRGQFMEAHTRNIDLPKEKPEFFSCVLEFLCKTNTARASAAKLKVACGSLRVPAIATVAEMARIAS
jgi:hypothetical protein